MNHDEDIAHQAGIARWTVVQTNPSAQDGAIGSPLRSSIRDEPVVDEGAPRQIEDGPARACLNTETPNIVSKEWLLDRRLRYPRQGNPHVQDDTKTETYPLSLDDHRRERARASAKKKSRRRNRKFIYGNTAGPNFIGEITLESPAQAGDFAKGVCEAGSTLNHFVLWTAVSTSPHGSCGYSIANKLNGDEWRYRINRTNTCYSLTAMALGAIKFAMEEALNHARAWPSTEHVTTTIRIFTPNRGALHAIRRLPMCSKVGSVGDVRYQLDVDESICTLSRQITETGAKLELHVSPASRVPGYRVALAAAKYACWTSGQAGGYGSEWTLAVPGRTHSSHPKEVKMDIEKEEDSTIASTTLEKDQEEKGKGQAKEKTWLQLINCFKAF